MQEIKRCLLPIIMLPFIGSLTACQTIIYHEPKVPKDYNAVYLNGEIIYEENGIKFHYSCNSMTGKSTTNELKPHRRARFYISIESGKTISGISIGKCKFENKKLRYSGERDYLNEKLEYKIITKNGNSLMTYEIMFDDFVPEKLFDGLFGFYKLKGTEYDTEFTITYEIDNMKYVTILKGIFWCYYVTGPIWLGT
jgi:hypothetical protein